VENSLEIAWRLDVGVRDRDLTLSLARPSLRSDVLTPALSRS
jgi:hypothetical protein